MPDSTPARAAQRGHFERDQSASHCTCCLKSIRATEDYSFDMEAGMAAADEEIRANQSEIGPTVWPPRVSGEVAWVDWRGRRREYSGPVVDLGSGIPRTHRSDAPPWGIRRAAYDLAFGYLSGFPLLDVLAFGLRSLLPSPVLAAEVSDQ